MRRHLVLVGGGHAHLATLVRCRDFVERGFRVTLVSDSAWHYYSGMGPGLLAGRYQPREVRIHVARLATDRGAAFVEDRLVRVEADRRLLHLRSGRTLGYDVVSFNIGSEVAPFPVASGASVFPVKPIAGLLDARRAIIALLGRGDPDVVVVGGGPASCEIAGCVWRLVKDRAGRARITIVSDTGLLAAYPRRVRELARRSLRRRGIAVREGRAAERIERDKVALTGGEVQRMDVAVLATGISPSPLFRESGLPVGPDGGLLVNRCLQGVSHPEIFGGGDAVSFAPRPLPNVGVYAVRQGMVLYRNTFASLSGAGLIPFEPQRDFLLIFNLGDDRALLTWRGLAWEGRLAWKLKERIDRSFMKRFQVSGERSATGGEGRDGSP